MILIEYTCKNALSYQLYKCVFGRFKNHNKVLKVKEFDKNQRFYDMGLR